MVSKQMDHAAKTSTGQKLQIEKNMMHECFAATLIIVQQFTDNIA